MFYAIAYGVAAGITVFLARKSREAFYVALLILGLFGLRMLHFRFTDQYDPIFFDAFFDWASAIIILSITGKVGSAHTRGWMYTVAGLFFLMVATHTGYFLATIDGTTVLAQYRYITIWNMLGYMQMMVVLYGAGWHEIILRGFRRLNPVRHADFSGFRSHEEDEK